MKKGDLVKAASAAAQQATVSGSSASPTWYKNHPWKTSQQIAIPERVGLVVRQFDPGSGNILPGETRVEVLTVDGIYTYRFEQLEVVE
tara:strand:- start:2729 stop:2992 length:264 start_codon:yes stop_codon:yes gene_type:complete